MKEKNLDVLIEDGIAGFDIKTDVVDSVMGRIEVYESAPKFSWFRMFLFPLMIMISAFSIWFIEKLFVFIRPNLEELNVNILFTKFSIHSIFICIILVMIYMFVVQIKSFRVLGHTVS